MAYGHVATVRSHRRGGPRRRRRIWPWIATLLSLSLVGGGLWAGYTYVLRGGCKGDALATISATPRLSGILKQLAEDWMKTSPEVDGTCARVDVLEADSAEVATQLQSDWDEQTEGTAPDVWVPDSSAWVRRASVDADAEQMMPDLQPSLARTPTVIAMPKQMADAAGMDGAPLTWKQIVDKLSAATGWGGYSHPDWGAFRIGLADPESSTAGLLALLAISDTNDDGEVDQTEKASLLNLKKVIKLQVNSTSDILTGLTNAAAQGADAGLRYVSAFPALEQDVLDYNLNHPVVPLEAIYPQDGTAEADFPYLILNAPWSTAQRKDVAAEFLRYARSATGKQAFLDAGLRDSNRLPGKELVANNGVEEKITALPRAVLLPDSVQEAASTWTAITRPTNVLLVFDTSGSMSTEVRGTGKNRLDLTKAAALGALNLLDDDARVGVWAFSTTQTGKEYHEVLPLGPLGKTTNGQTHRDAATAAIQGLFPAGNTGLYDTVWAAQQAVQHNLVPNAANLVVLLTDGADDNNSGTLTLDDLLAKLRAASGDQATRVPVITVGLGTDTNSDVLRQISAATHAGAYSSPTSFDISQVVLTALFAHS
jgi:Ca-activated chloride channel family protein